ARSAPPAPRSPPPGGVPPAPGTTPASQGGPASLWGGARPLSSGRAGPPRLDLAPVVIDAHEVRRKAHRPLQKSDRRDALALCEGLSRGFYQSVVHVPSPEIGELRTILSRRRQD